MSFSFPWELALMTWLQAHMGPGAVTAAAILSMLGDKALAAAAVLILYWCCDKEHGKALAVNLCAAVTFNSLFKNLALRRRPYCDHPEIRCLRPPEAAADVYDLEAQGYSFPSGHSSTAAAAYGTLAFFRPRLRALAVLLSLLVGISRVCLGVHYPTDVLGGWALGALVTIALGEARKRMKRTALLFPVLALLGLPGWFFCRSTDYYSGYGLMLGLFAAILFEERFVDFAVTRRPLRAFLRVALGLGLFLGLNALLKLPFREDLLSGGSFPAHLIRAGRYALCAFTVMGLYPLLFRHADRFWQGRNITQKRT